MSGSTKIGSQKHSVAIHWFRNGLRFHDNPCFKDACEQSETLIPLYVIDPDAPFAQTPGRRAGCIRANFILDSMQDTDRKLREQSPSNSGSRMIVILGRPEEVLPKVIAATSATALYYEREAAEPVRKADSGVLQAIRDRETRESQAPAANNPYHRKKKEMCTVHGYETHTLHPMERYLAKAKGGIAPSTYGGFTKIFQSMPVVKEVETVTRVPPLPEDVFEKLQKAFPSNTNHFGIPKLEQLGYEEDLQNDKLKNRKKGGIDFDGGEDHALALLQYMMSRAKWVASFEKPKTSPNALTVDTTGLSPCTSYPIFLLF